MTGSTGSTSATLTPYAGLGILSLDGAGNFTINQYQFGNPGAATTSSASNASTPLSASGTYTVGANCTLNLSFATPSPGATGVLTAPATFDGLLGLSTSFNTGSVTTTTNQVQTGFFTFTLANGQVVTGMIVGQ